MTYLEKFIELTNSASEQQEIFSLFQQTMIKLGYDRILYSRLTDHPTINMKAAHGVVHNYPEDWMKHYSKNGYFSVDPIIKHAFRTSSAYTWNNLLNNYCLSKQEKKVINEAQEAKLLDGVAIAIHGSNLETAGVGLASSQGGINPDKNTLSLIHALANQFHLAYSEFEHKKYIHNKIAITLTPREEEVLSWAAEGKSIASIADILSRSQRTVRFHLENELDPRNWTGC